MEIATTKMRFPLRIEHNTPTDFIKEHFALMMDFFDVKTKYSKILLEVVLLSNPETQIISLTKYLKREIAKKLHYKNLQSIDSALNSLVYEGFLIRIAQSTFKLNNWILQGVDWRRICAIDLILDYVPEGREIDLTVRTKDNKSFNHKSFVPYHINPLRENNSQIRGF